MLDKLLRSFARRDPQVFPPDENGDILFQIWRRGCDLSTPRKVDFSLIFPGKEQAEAFAAKLKQRDAKVEIGYFDAKACWDVRFSPKLVPSWKNITEMEERLAKLAQAHRGRNDGWGFLF